LNQVPQFSFTQTAPAWLLAGILFVGLLLIYVVAHGFRRYHLTVKPDFAVADLNTINGMLLGLLGLMLAFSFSMANERFNSRRGLVIEEANDIGTVVLRLDVLPDSLRTVLRTSMKQYLEERIAFYDARMDLNRAAAHYYRADSISSSVWRAVVGHARKDNLSVIASEIIPALNAMIDITTTRRAAGEATLPPTIIYFLFALCLGSAFMLGYDHKGPVNWVVLICFATMLSATVFTVIDLDRPRSGLINLDGPHQRMVDLRSLF